MRRIALHFFLLLAFTLGAPAVSRSQSPTADSDHLRATARQLLQSNSPDDAVKAADLLQKASQIDLQNAEALKSNTERHDLEQPPRTSWAALASTLAPVLTTLILAGTLLFNIYQARISEQEKREETLRLEEQAEKKRYADALELLQKATDVSPAAALINSFPDEPFLSGMRAMGRTVLLSSKSSSEFHDLFNTLFSQVTGDNLSDALEILRSVHQTVGPLLSKTWIGGTNDMTKLTADEIQQYNLLTDERTFVGEKVAAFLRQPRDPAALPLNLTGCGFDGNDLSGANLRGARISNTTWNLVNFDGCDLRGISEFGNCWLYFTAWWNAAHIEPALLDYFKTNFAYTPGYRVNSPHPVTMQGYQDNLSRLEAQAP